MSDTILDYSHYFWQGDKIRLRAFTVEDAGQRFARSLDSISRQEFNIGIELPTTVELQKAFLEEYGGCKQANNRIVFALETHERDYAGVLTLHSIDERHGKFSFGILVDRAYRRRGFAEDAVRIILKYGFLERRFQKCNSACDSENHASIHLHRKLGFIQEGRLRREWFYNGDYHDELLFGLTREEYDAANRTGS